MNDKKEAWVAPEVCRVKLEPEQAVLSCCWAGERGEVHDPPGVQCVDPGLAGCAYNHDPVSGPPIEYVSS